MSTGLSERQEYEDYYALIGQCGDRLRAADPLTAQRLGILGDDRGVIAGARAMDLFAEQTTEMQDAVRVREASRAWGADLLSIDTSEPQPWTPGLPGLIHPGQRGLLTAKQGAGKSLVALMAAVQCVEAGGEVIYADAENGTVRMAERLECIIAGRDVRQLVEQRLHYWPSVPFGRMEDDDAVRDYWLQTVRGVDLVIIDSLPRVLSACGKEENSNSDFQNWMGRFVDPIAHGRTAHLLMDNAGWAEADRSRGASAKWDLVEVVYLVRGGDKVSAAKHGPISLERRRSRHGDEAEYLQVGAGGGEYGRLESTDEKPVKERTPESKNTAIETVKDLLQSDPTHEWPVKDLESETSLDRRTVQRHLEHLNGEGFADIVKDSWPPRWIASDRNERWFSSGQTEHLDNPHV